MRAFGIAEIAKGLFGCAEQFGAAPVSVLLRRDAYRSVAARVSPPANGEDPFAAAQGISDKNQRAALGMIGKKATRRFSNRVSLTRAAHAGLNMPSASSTSRFFSRMDLVPEN